MCRFACAIVIALLGANSIAQTATDLDCAQCVDGSEIENYSIPTWKLQNHTIGFNKLKNDVRDRMFGTEDRVEALEALVATLQAQVAALQAQAHPDPDPNNILSFFSLENTNDIVITSANLHVRNGVGQTDLANGLGNIIIGYNEDYQGGAPKERSGSHAAYAANPRRFINGAPKLKLPPQEVWINPVHPEETPESIQVNFPTLPAAR